MKHERYIKGGIFVIALLIVYVLVRNAPTGSRAPQVLPATSQQSTQQQVNINDIKPADDWKIGISEQGSFAIAYPPDISFQTDNQGRVTFLKAGPTQQENQSLSDGINLVVGTGGTSGKEFNQFVTDATESLKNRPETINVSNPRTVRYAGFVGSTFEYTSQDDRVTYIYLSVGVDTVFEIHNRTLDPTNQGYANTVNRMLNTLTLAVPKR